MSLFGSLFTGVSALGAQSQSMAFISNNIANVNTVGFKRSDAAFQSLVASSVRAAKFSPGSVIARRDQTVTEQGALRQTGSGTDVAINGNGFFVVQRNTDAFAETLYTRAGAFSEDSQGLLRNTAGFVLMGWPIDSNGNIPANQSDLTSVQPVDVAFLGGLTRPTTEATLGINLDADQAQVTFPVPAGTPPDFNRSITVFDSLGSAQVVDIEFRHVVAPTANSTSQLAPPGAQGTTLLTAIGAVVGEQINVGTSTTVPAVFTVGAASTMQDLLDFINAQANLDASLSAQGQLFIQVETPGDDMVLNDVGAGTLLDAGALNMTAEDPADPATFANTLNNTPFVQSPPNTQGWWEMRFIHPNGSTVTQGLINFQGNGSINGVNDADNEIKVDINGIDWGNGSNPQDIDFLIDRFSQFAGNFNVIFADQNGAELGLRTGVEIDRDGFVIAQFSNGQTANLFKIPLATFANANGLTEQSGTAFSENSESGTFNLREAGTSGSGILENATVEGSNVDLAEEFSKMIITQRAFSGGARAISTADEMTEELLRLR